MTHFCRPFPSLFTQHKVFVKCRCEFMWNIISAFLFSEGPLADSVGGLGWQIPLCPLLYLEKEIQATGLCVLWQCLLPSCLLPWHQILVSAGRDTRGTEAVLGRIAHKPELCSRRGTMLICCASGQPIVAFYVGNCFATNLELYIDSFGCVLGAMRRKHCCRVIYSRACLRFAFVFIAIQKVAA